MAVELIGTGVPSVYLVPVGGGNAGNIFAAASDLANYIPTSSIATTTEAIAGTSASKVVTPAGVRAVTTEWDRDLDQKLNFHFASSRVSSKATCPGVVPYLYGHDFEGPASVITSAALNNVVETTEGLAYRLFGERELSTMEAYHLYGGRKWKVDWIIRRAVDSADPEGDALEAKIIWLGDDLTTAGLTVTGVTVNAGATDIVAADGWVTYSAVVSSANLSGVTHYNTEAVYFRPGVIHFGSADVDGPRADVLVLAVTDVTNNTFSTDTAADMEARLAALEAASPFSATVQAPGTSLDALTVPGNYYVSSPAGAPSGAASTVGVRVTYVDANTLLQEVFDAAGVLDQMFRRYYISGAFGSWYQEASVDYVDQQIAELANSIALGTSGEFTPTFLAPGASGFSVAYGAATKARYNRTPGGWVNVYGTITFTPTYSAGAVQIYIGGLPYPAAVESGVFDAPILVQPAGNWVYPGDHKRTVGWVGSGDTDAIVIGFEATDTGGASERKNYALSQLPSGTQYQLQFSGGYQDAT